MPRYRRAAKMTLLSFVALMLIVLMGCGKKNDISGTWKGKITLPQTGVSMTDLEFILAQKGRVVNGTMVFTKAGGNLPLSGTVTGGKVELSSPMKNGLSVTIGGTLERPKLVRGTAVLNYDAPLGKRPDETILEMTR